MIIDPQRDPEVVHSDRFTFIDMKGSFSRRVEDGLRNLSGASGPPVPQLLRKRQGPEIPYGEQSGLTRFAPSPKNPPTKITLKSAEPLYPTSDFDIARSYLPLPTVSTTMSVEVPVSGIENTVCLPLFPPFLFTLELPFEATLGLIFRL